MVKDKNIAMACWEIKWKNFITLISKSIGIELVNKGHNLDIKIFLKNKLKV